MIWHLASVLPFTVKAYSHARLHNSFQNIPTFTVGGSVCVLNLITENQSGHNANRGTADVAQSAILA